MLHSRNPLRTIITLAAFGLALISLAGVALAGTFEIQPARISLSAKEPTALVKVSNPGAEETIVKFDVADWSQSNGADRLTRSRALIVAPSHVTLRPGESKTVRVGIRMSAPRWKEETYRLLVREIPRPPNVGIADTRTASSGLGRTMSLPVFVLPPGHVRPRLSWSLARSNDGAMELYVSNNGGKHVQLKTARLRGPSGQTLDAGDMSAFLLPGQGRTLLLAGDATAGSRWQLIAETDAGPIEAELEFRAN